MLASCLMHRSITFSSDAGDVDELLISFVSISVLSPPRKPTIVLGTDPTSIALFSFTSMDKLELSSMRSMLGCRTLRLRYKIWLLSIELSVDSGNRSSESSFPGLLLLSSMSSALKLGGDDKASCSPTSDDLRPVLTAVMAGSCKTCTGGGIIPVSSLS